MMMMMMMQEKRKRNTAFLKTRSVYEMFVLAACNYH